MQIPGLTQEEIFTLSRNIGNQDKGFKAKSTPYEVNKLLKKAIDKGTTEENLAKILGLEATTMFYRHSYIFEHLISKLHKKVIYGSSEMKKDREKEGYITFQVANELSRIKENFQLEVYEFITKNHIHGWQDVKSIKELLVINNYKNSKAIFEEILQRKGLDKHFRVGDKLDLNSLNKKLFKASQQDRDKVFFKLATKIYGNKIHSASLGYRFYEIVFKEEQIKISQKILDENKKRILEEIEQYK